ncbi:MAG: serine/threonine protein kinase [Planctomycetes bacterium]|jgi:non-specific serine/threonine protein kinase/serine/threonine-protein kinase|nr:serine/threonine protein kinase [Planctomycetota bacterium]
MSHELPRTWLLPLLLAATQPATELSAGTAAAGLEAVVTAPRAESDPGATGTNQERDFGPWRVVTELGSGGMGTVYLVESTGPIARRAALKVIRADRIEPATVARFTTEQQALATADHEHVVRLYDTGITAAGQPWLAMEFVDGETITRYCERRELDLDARLRLVAEVADAVQHLHSRGMRHGDLKPDNILVVERAGRPVPKLIDLGLATVPGHAVPDELAAAGTPAYMAPEQFTRPAAAIDERGEVYTLGVVLHEVLTGKRPGGEAAVGADGILQARLQTAPCIESSLPRRLRQLLTRALAQQREQRQASVEQFAVDLQRAVAQRATVRRAITTAGITVAGALAGLATGWLAFL